jgi:tripartite-type tricarboxylate transporter receptor subunit TctC
MLMPELPTLAESGYPNLVLGSWNGFLAPARTPMPILDKINGEVLRGIALPGVKERLLTLGQEFLPLDVAGYRAFIEADVTRWRVLVDSIGRDRLVATP